LQHPSLTQVNKSGEQMKETLEALKEMNIQTILIYPNADAGGRKMIKVIKKYEKYDFLHTYKSLPRKDYLSLMKYASLMVGNSSSGTIDTPFFKIPVINIGTRESVRENAGNKIFVEHNKKQIVRAIKRALFDKKFRKIVKNCKNPYGNGKAGEKITAILKKIKINNKLLVKRLTY
jgi:UDP-hydrolysing UDP-N-acetyl-D-glucosamine 2-epimerase